MTDETEPTVTTAAGETRTPEEIRTEIEQTREQLGQTVEALAEKTDVKARAHEQIDTAKETVAENVEAAKKAVTENVGAAKEAVTHQADEILTRVRGATPESAQAGIQQAQTTVQEKPLPFAAAGAFAAGLLIGWMIGRR